ncbi:MAG: hypothetical protein A2Z72_05770 [Omnitrophica bacterium RBG_13_46_9]|nr:MAG: hypothetical protein A2Z72_05770 [Omnitrophica bacterium RBG_13_46_9]
MLLTNGTSIRYAALFVFGAAGVLYKFFNILTEIKNKDFRAQLSKHGIFIMIFFWWISGLYSMGWSGKLYPHYCNLIMPSAALLSGYFAEYFFRQSNKRLMLTVFMLIFIVFSPLPSDVFNFGGLILIRNTPLLRYAYGKMPRLVEIGIKRNFNYDLIYIKDNKIYLDDKYYLNIGGFSYIYRRAPAVKWIMKNTSDGDFIYFWGAETTLNFLTKKRSPTKYTYLYPLMERGYTTEHDLQRFISDLKEKRPKFIIDTSQSNDLIPPISPEDTEDKNGYDRKLLLPAIKFIRDNYKYELTIDEWDVYKITRRQPVG